MMIRLASANCSARCSVARRVVAARSSLRRLLKLGRLTCPSGSTSPPPEPGGPGPLVQCRARAARSEAVPGVAEVALGEREDLGGRYREHQDRLNAIWVVEAPAAHLVLPSSVPLRGPRLSEALEQVIVGELDGVTLDDDVQPCVPVVAASRQDHVRVAAQVDGLLLGSAGAEADGAVEPHGDERGHVRSAVGPDRGDPEQLRRFERPAGLIPPGGNGIRGAEPRVEFSYWRAHRRTPSDSYRPGDLVVSRMASPLPVPARSCRLPRSCTV